MGVVLHHRKPLMDSEAGIVQNPVRYLTINTDADSPKIQTQPHLSGDADHRRPEVLVLGLCALFLDDFGLHHIFRHCSGFSISMRCLIPINHFDITVQPAALSVQGDNYQQPGAPGRIVSYDLNGIPTDIKSRG